MGGKPRLPCNLSCYLEGYLWLCCTSQPLTPEEDIAASISDLLGVLLEQDFRIPVESRSQIQKQESKKRREERRKKLLLSDVLLHFCNSNIAIFLRLKYCSIPSPVQLL
ncbi:hypothetical protein Y1Q_0009873 [Alligator mississippiensis]|uniref:Uncharacterized protein n=1 Tax=Alligator mississippiensis TaxID=8496 RepID=A0A151MX37_ALLMI|nr:hypothetical protein Y1Q_0009873 [Alligator mississippiensis]